MTRLSPTLQSALGLRADQVVEAVLELPPPPSEVGHGAGPSELPLGAGIAAELMLAVERAAFFSPVPELAEAFGQRAKRWDNTPEVLLFEGLGEPKCAVGAVERMAAGVWVMDSRAAESALLFEQGGVDRLVVGRQGTLSIYEPPRPVAAELGRSLADARKEPVLEVPDIEQLTAGRTVAAWVVEEATRRLEAAALFLRVAGVGLLARHALGSAPSGAGTLESLLSAALTPARACAEWAKSLTPDALAEVERQLVEEAGDVGDCIEDFCGLVEHGSEYVEQAARDVCLRRDDLESVSFVLSQAGRGELTAEVLAGLDELAILRLSYFLLAGDYDSHQLLSSVAWQEPDAWWGTRAEQ